MKTRVLFLVTGFLFVSGLLLAQTNYSSKEMSLKIDGTSSMHDWDMTSSSGSCEATLKTDASGNLTEVSKMTFRTKVNTLKSGKNGLDKNAYKALESDKHPEISASLKSATVSPKGNGFEIISRINLIISGQTKETDLTALAVKEGDGFRITGTKKINMEDYGVKAPSFMLGAMKTGEIVDLSFNTLLKK
jgi:polyisoprenoid-binding protein YceI